MTESNKYIEASNAASIISEALNIPLEKLVDVFAEIPRADVEKVRYGMWICGEFHIHRCSECGVEVTRNQISNFCPNCGARMKGINYGESRTAENS